MKYEFLRISKTSIWKNFLLKEKMLLTEFKKRAKPDNTAGF